jgi:peptide/nickel transport system permease protein
MLREVLERVAALVPVLLGIAIITFFLIRLVPGDVVDVMLGEQNDPQVAAELRRSFGLDRPLYEQFAIWFGGLLRGDLGKSVRSGRPAMQEIADRFEATAELTVAALIVSVLIAIPVGVLSATRRNSRVDLLARLGALIGLSIPNFWLGILLMMLFSVALRLLPSGGYVAPSENLGENLKYLLMPTLTLGAALAAVTARMTRSSLLEVLRQDYVRTARAKGLRESTVTYRHGLRNALIPVITVLGIQAGRLLGGTVVVEQIFSWPGVGSLIIRAISQRDYALVQASVMVLAFFFVFMNLVVDVLYVYIDPRLRRG